MSRKAVKMFAVLVAVLLAVTSLAACGKSAQPPKAETSAQATGESSAAKTNKPLEEVTLKFYIPGDKPVAFDEVWQAISEKTKEVLNAKFTVNFIPWGDYADKMLVLTAAGDNYDLNFDGNWLNYGKMVNKGAYLGLNELAPKYMPKYYKKMEAAGVIPACSVKGQLTAIPWDVPKSNRAFFLYRADIAEKAGFNKEIKTIEDVEECLLAMKKAAPELTPIFWNAEFLGSPIVRALMAKYEYDYTSFHHFTVSINDSKLGLIPIEQTEMFKEGVETAKKWVDKGLVSKNLLASKDQPHELFQNGQMLGWIGFTDLAYRGDLNSGFVKGGNAKVATAELYPDKKFVMESPLGNMNCINKNAANPERTLMFIDIVSTDRKIYDMFMYGLLDKTYILDGEMVKLPASLKDQSNYVNWSGQWGFWRQDFRRPDFAQDANFFKQYKAFTDRPVNVQSKIAGILPDTEPVKNEIAKRNQLFEQSGKPLVCGLIDGNDVDAAINKYIDMQKAAGLDKILAELQKQIDAQTK